MRWNHKTFAVINGASIDISDRISYTESDDIATKLAILNPFRYRSYYFDIEIGYYYLQSRYYDPQVGRFISPDDISYLDPTTINGLNLYAYCANNPVMNIDPDGHAWYNVLKWIGLGLVVAAATVLTCGAAGVGVGKAAVGLGVAAGGAAIYYLGVGFAGAAAIGGEVAVVVGVVGAVAIYYLGEGIDWLYERFKEWIFE